MGCVSQLHSLHSPILSRLPAWVQLSETRQATIYFAFRSGFRSLQTSMTTQRLALDRSSSVLHSFFESKSEY